MGIGVVDVTEHLLAARADVHFVSDTANRVHQRLGVCQSALSGGETRHREGEKVGPRQRQ